MKREEAQEPGRADAGQAANEATGGADREPVPLAPDSLTWKYFGDLRGLLLISRVGTLQNMHPGVAAGVTQHSDLFKNPWNRLLRSIPPILGVIYDGAAAPGTGRTVRDFHRNIKGTDAHGRAYHALNPDIYYWAHATFFEGQIALQEFFGEPLTEEAKERLYRESMQWYALYGLTMQPVPPDYASFKQYWDRMLDEVLENTSITQWYFHPVDEHLPAPYPWLRGPLWLLLSPVVSRGSRWLAIGTLPPRLRDRLDLQWSAGDERRLRLLGTVVRTLWRAVPAPWGYMPRARKAFHRIARQKRSERSDASHGNDPKLRWG